VKDPGKNSPVSSGQQKQLKISELGSIPSIAATWKLGAKLVQKSKHISTFPGPNLAQDIRLSSFVGTYDRLQSISY
jgi:hypothetical protein